MSNTNDLISNNLASNTDSDDNTAFYINESLINSVIRLRTSLVIKIILLKSKSTSKVCHVIH